MDRLSSISDFDKWRQLLESGVDSAESVVTICAGTGCTALGSAQVYEAFEQQIQKQKLTGRVRLKRTGCHGFCEKGPVVVILPRQFFYPGVQAEDVEEILTKTVLGGDTIDRLLYVDPATGKKVAYEHEVPFYAGQQRNVFRYNGKIDPVSIEDYVTAGGYGALSKALRDYAPERVVEIVKQSGLRGRGGGGFPTGLKWELCRANASDKKYLICNADEGDPGAFMDRSVLEGTPHAVLEGMVIAGLAIGASRGFIYVRAEYPLAVKNTTAAIEVARAAGLLGESILGTDSCFDIEIRQGAGAFVCGEETALIASLEGKRGMPSPRPPFPVQKGYLGKPTVINNVETFANVPLIIRNGANWYNQIGTEKSKGTKIFALAGKVNNTGLVEVPMGATLREIIFEIGGGIPKGRKFKAAQMGGPSGGCIPAAYLDTEIDYDSVQQIGAIMGSGGLIVMDENTCMVDVARYFLEFVQSESCGKCTPCRVGTKKMLAILERITRGQGNIDDLDVLERLGQDIKKASLCGLGQTAPNPVLSTLRHFREEYEEHIILKTCRASVCEGLVRSPCQHGCPAGVNVPEYVSMITEGRLTEAAAIIRRRNPFVSVCGRVCDHPCERRCRRGEIDQPLAIRALKRYIADNMPDFAAPMVRPVSKKAELAIIGSGPAGLSCGYFLALMGRASVIFEAQPIPGGMLALGIPEFRLPKQVLQKEIEFILSHGVELRTNSRVEDARQLRKEGFKAVFVATGAQKGRGIDIEGMELAGVVDSLEFLRERGLGRGMDCRGKAIVVLGGGNAAIDVARSAVRLGTEKVTILYRRSLEEMPAYGEEIQGAMKEGIELVTLGVPTRILGENGAVSGVEFVRAELGKAEADGRRRPIPIDGSQTTISCDLVIPAIGQIPSVEPAHFANGPELTKWGTIKADPVTFKTTTGDIFAGGDCVTGPSSVIEAIAAGQKAAASIDKFLGGKGELPRDTGFSFTKPDEEALAKSPLRFEEKEIPVVQRRRGFAEVVLGIDREQALAEAFRCLRCDLEK
ncbi:MAG TPA: NADH-ubiquinone oxidoreductase-F iron-sulfur binding region domain-containing protein [Sedimentisphaerales bacterium]|nr:NADH-ubiquinone oxidoreductase-F iron-sulfur binding region domain-containing protein [Sedimentisphaerales bacterium]